MGALEVLGPCCLPPHPSSAADYLHACPFDGQASGPLQYFLPPLLASKADEDDLPPFSLQIPVGPDVPVWHNILAMLPYLEAVVPIQGKPFFQRLLWLGLVAFVAAPASLVVLGCPSALKAVVVWVAGAVPHCCWSWNCPG